VYALEWRNENKEKTNLEKRPKTFHQVFSDVCLHSFKRNGEEKPKWSYSRTDSSIHHAARVIDDGLVLYNIITIKCKSYS
jgi:hypothetical protein